MKRTRKTRIPPDFLKPPEGVRDLVMTLEMDLRIEGLVRELGREQSISVLTAALAYRDMAKGKVCSCGKPLNYIVNDELQEKCYECSLVRVQ